MLIGSIYTTIIHSFCDCFSFTSSCFNMICYIDIMRFQVLTDDQTKLVFEVKKDDLGKSFLAELNKAITGKH